MNNFETIFLYIYSKHILCIFKGRSVMCITCLTGRETIEKPPSITLLNNGHMEQVQ